MSILVTRAHFAVNGTETPETSKLSFASIAKAEVPSSKLWNANLFGFSLVCAPDISCSIIHALALRLEYSAS